MSRTRDFVTSERDLYLTEFDNLEKLLGDIEAEMASAKSQTVRGGLLLYKKATFQDWTRYIKEVSYYDQLLNDRNFNHNDLDYLISVEIIKGNHLPMIINACIQYYKFIDSGIDKGNAFRDIESLEKQYATVIKFLDHSWLPLTPRLIIPKTPKVIKSELLSSLMMTGFEKDNFRTLLECLPIEGEKAPKGHRPPPTKTNDGKKITYFTTSSRIK